jgi:hypothetical protein
MENRAAGVPALRAHTHSASAPMPMESRAEESDAMLLSAELVCCWGPQSRKEDETRILKRLDERCLGKQGVQISAAWI